MFARNLHGVSFPICIQYCDTVEHFGKRECRKICPHKFDALGAALELKPEARENEPTCHSLVGQGTLRQGHTETSVPPDSSNPEPWQCLPYAFALATGVPFDVIIKVVGHDGSEIVDTEEEPPYNRRGFCIGELSHALWGLGYGVVRFDETVLTVGRGEKERELCKLSGEKMIHGTPGVICGMFDGDYHAEYWNGSTFPRTVKEGRKIKVYKAYKNVEVLTFCAVVRR
jgi:hypothetical protein